MAAALIEVPNFIFVMNICMVTMLISPTIITRNDSGWIAEPRTSTQNAWRKAKVSGEIRGEGIRFEKEVSLYRGEVKEVVFTPEEFPQLVIRNPRLWWPLNKGKQELYDLTLKVEFDGKVSDSISTPLIP